jgi:hypothetical protein
MLTSGHFIAVAIATTSILIQSLSSINTPVDRTFKRVSIALSFATPALADTPSKAKPAVRYVPPKRGNPKSTQATGSRGCTQVQQSPVSLTLLVPKDHDGLTTSSHPTFFWHVSAPVQMAFTLTQRGVVQPLWEQQIQPSAAGIVQLQMPNNLPELLVGKEYRWSVTLLCNRDRPSANPFIQTWIERIPTTPSLTQQLAAAPTDRDRASIYAQAGLWYDALAAISAAHTANPKDISILEERLLLLDSVGLERVAAQERQSLARQ